MNTFDLKFSGKQIDLDANQEKTIPLNQADEITFYSQTGAFEISIDGGEYVPIPTTKRLAFPAGYMVDRINVKDTSGSSNTIKFYTGNVSVFNTDEVAINGSVNIAAMPDVQIAAGQSVAISGTPNVTVNSLPDVEIAAGQSVGITGTPNVAVTSLPDVTLVGGQSVSISGTPTVNNTPTAAAQTASIANIAASTAYANKRWLRIENTGGVATTISIGGVSKTLAIGATLEMPLLGRSESYPSITVDGATSACTVETIDA